MASTQNPQSNDRSFLLLKPSTSSNIGGPGGEPRSSWTTTDSDNSESILPMSTASPDANSRLKEQSSSIQPSSFGKTTGSRSDALNPTNGSPAFSYPPLSNSSSFAPSPNAHHTRSLTASTANSSQAAVNSNPNHSPRAHPYQLAAYDSFNYRSAQVSKNDVPPQANPSASPPPAARDTIVSANGSRDHTNGAVYEKQSLSPRTPNTALPTNTLLSDVEGDRQAELDRRRRQQQRAQRRQSLATVASFGVLNGYNMPSNPGAIASTMHLHVPSDPKSAALTAIIIGSMLAVPLVLSVIYISVGHAVLRAAKPATSIYSRTTLTSSVQAGAVGGAILAIPILLVVYLMGLFPPGDSPESRGDTRSRGQDFFDDDSDAGLSKNLCSPRRLSEYAAWLGCVLLVFGVGAVSGALGVTVLSSSNLDTFNFSGRKEFLSPGTAAMSGLVGGAIVLGSIVATILLWVATVILFSNVDNFQPPDSEPRL
ncbi:hypothetical protein CC1G_02669 [Coprinopsis cinerea okayama7|uniref:Uncharacterized protein n=1 Tax=Coprinopsis cinerea (strain Okayama-7 / 130 / ATCC MYA-4618 / FGSC 9003) TaxID=240176 RepID=A8PBK5_COPC7|nr:hypothetical protein CC1G_02669 [Coprinopsis cinerea okayama7\|eukprot:XP_001840206.2 hypothetical protein CC1G_02669 [Coprinopsis cinerea okayama7\